MRQLRVSLLSGLYDAVDQPVFCSFLEQAGELDCQSLKCLLRLVLKFIPSIANED